MSSEPLLIRSFAKINLALAVLYRRADNYHEIRTVYQSIDLHDTLEFFPCDILELDCDGLPGVENERNLAWKAAKTISAAAAPNRGVRIRLHKRIPVGAGLGGGSSNAAATLMGLHRFWDLQLPPARMHDLAAELGADVPFFLHGGTALGVGRGDEIYPLPEIRPVHLVVIYPNIHVSTALAYQSLSLALTPNEAALRIQSFCGQLAIDRGYLAGLFNDFETSILSAHGVIREAKEFLECNGATMALMSGSGSSVFGFFPEEESALAASELAMRNAWRVFPAKTLSRVEYFHQLIG